MDDLSKIVKESKAKVNRIDNEIDYLEKEQVKYKEVKKWPQ